MNKLSKCIFTGLLALYCLTAFGEEKNEEKRAKAGQPHTVAILNFSERGSGVKDTGSQVAELMFAHLVSNANIWLVERQDLQKVLTEAELNLSGAVNPNQAIQVGQLSGARIIITGSVFKIRNKTYIVAKVIGTETSRVLGESTNGTNSLDELSEELAKKVSALIEEEAKKLLAKKSSKKNLIAELKTKMKNTKKPTVYIDINEEHLGKKSKDPAAQTEFQLICKELGFTVTGLKADAELIITGEGFSEFSARRQKLISVKARLEVKIVDRQGKIVAVDRQTDIAVDLAENIAGKTALQSAAQKVAVRLLTKLIKK